MTYIRTILSCTKILKPPPLLLHEYYTATLYFIGRENEGVFEC
jgi:hypothetical protein